MVWRIKFKKDYRNATHYDSNISNVEVQIGFGPLSFIVSLLVWPIILFLDIRNRINELLARAEVLSRRKNMLSLLSKGDEKLIQLGKTMKLKEFRAYLESIGQTRKHSFVKAFVVSCILFLAPQARTIASHTNTKQYSISTTIQSVDHDVGNNFHTQNIVYDYLVPEKGEIPIPLTTKIHFINTPLKVLKGFSKKIDGVPRVINQFCKTEMIY